MLSDPAIPENLRDFLSFLANCPHGKGNIVPTTPCPTSLDLFAACATQGWAEEFRSGPIRIWKITPQGRAALYPVMIPFTSQLFQQAIAEC